MGSMRKSSTSKPERRRQDSTNFATLAAKSPFIQGWRIECLSEGGGRARLRMPVLEAHQNSIGTVHGGVLAALADTACGIAYLSLAAPGSGFVTANLNINYIGAPAGDFIEASAEVVASRKRMAFAEVVLTDASGAQVAHATAVFYVSAP